MKEFFSPEPAVFADHGGVNSFPKNTISCFEEAFSIGADGIFITVQMSKDNVVMVIPDGRGEKLWGGSGAVKDYTSAELKEFDAGFNYADNNGNFPLRGKGYKYATLEELLLYFPDKKFNITILNKGREFVDEYSAVIERCNAVHRVLTVSVYGSAIKAVRKKLPRSATAFSLSGLLGVYSLFKSGFMFAATSFTADVLQTAEKIGASYIANAGLVRQLQNRGVKVFVWGFKSLKDLQRLYDAGVDGYIADDVEMVKSFLDTR
jgi:glycerophosphoryl diester phosphodiesterase